MIANAATDTQEMSQANPIINNNDGSVEDVQQENDTVYHIGILSIRGIEKTTKKWQKLGRSI